MRCAAFCEPECREYCWQFARLLLGPAICNRTGCQSVCPQPAFQRTLALRRVRPGSARRQHAHARSGFRICPVKQFGVSWCARRIRPRTISSRPKMRRETPTSSTRCESPCAKPGVASVPHQNQTGKTRCPRKSGQPRTRGRRAVCNIRDNHHEHAETAREGKTSMPPAWRSPEL